MALVAGRNESLLFAWDSHSGRRFLIDTGAEVSVLPATGLDTRTGQSGSSLKAANGSSIKTYGVRTTTLRLATRQYKWEFIIADVARPLLGADFLRANSLLVDLKGKRLVDAETYLSIPLGNAQMRAPRLATISASTDKYDLLRAEFPDITTPNFSNHPPNIAGSTLFPPRDHRCMPAPDAYLQTSWCWPRLNLTGWKPWESSVVRPVPGHRHSIWCPNRLEAGALVEIIGASKQPLSLSAPHPGFLGQP